MAVEVLTLRSLFKPATSVEVTFKRGVEGTGEKRTEKPKLISYLAAGVSKSI